MNILHTIQVILAVLGGMASAVAILIPSAQYPGTALALKCIGAACGASTAALVPMAAGASTKIAMQKLGRSIAPTLPVLACMIAYTALMVFVVRVGVGCGPTAQPANIPADVVAVDIALCKLETDLGGPTIPLLCPMGPSGAMVHVTVPRGQWLAMRAASHDGGI